MIFLGKLIKIKNPIHNNLDTQPDSLLLEQYDGSITTMSGEEAL